MDLLVARQHFEAVISDLAKMYDEDRVSIREEVKTLLSKREIIKFSTTELDDEALKAYAHKLTCFYKEQESTPPEFRAELDLEKILF